MTGRNIRSVVFTVDGRKVSTARAQGGAVATVKVATKGLKPGVHTLTAKVTFTDGTKAKTLSGRFSRCSNAAIAPRFTG